MAMQERQAQASWEGDLAGGSGHVKGITSGALPELPVTWAARTEAHGGKTSPEELIAAAHASCFSMALSHELAQGGNAPDRLEVTATVTLDRVDGAPTVTRSALEVRGRVPGIDAAAFEAAAQSAGRNCPISRLLLGGSAEIVVVSSTLET
jgi:osmotically inducible protein OsmC